MVRVRMMPVRVGVGVGVGVRVTVRVRALYTCSTGPASPSFDPKLGIGLRVKVLGLGY